MAGIFRHIHAWIFFCLFSSFSIHIAAFTCSHCHTSLSLRQIEYTFELPLSLLERGGTLFSSSAAWIWLPPPHWLHAITHWYRDAEAVTVTPETVRHSLPEPVIHWSRSLSAFIITTGMASRLPFDEKEPRHCRFHPAYATPLLLFSCQHIFTVLHYYADDDYLCRRWH